MVPRRVLRGVRPGDARGWKDSTGTGAQGDGAGVQGGVRGGAAQGGVHHPDAWAKLVVCLVIDGLGDSSFLFPGLGELSDAAYAPLEAFLLGQLFQSNAISGVGFVEEALPFTDILPTATIAWLLENFFADTWPGKALGLSSPRASRDEDEDDRDAKKK